MTWIGIGMAFYFLWAGKLNDLHGYAIICIPLVVLYLF